MIRQANIGDLKVINDIYNQAVASEFETADMEPTVPEDRNAWFNQENATSFPVFVYEENGKVAAWLSFKPYRPGRKALRFTAEISYYVHNEFKKLGIGSSLIKFALKESKTLKFKSLIAIVLDRNQSSISLLKKFNFAPWGNLPAIADFNGVECGHLYYGIRV